MNCAFVWKMEINWGKKYWRDDLSALSGDDGPTNLQSALRAFILEMWWHTDWENHKENVDVFIPIITSADCAD